MDSRGLKMYAVMAIRDGWGKPRFVWDGQLIKRLHIYGTRTPAIRRAKLMNDPKQVGGKALFQLGYHDKSHNTPKLIEVRWIVVPVWTETMFTQHGEGIWWGGSRG